MDSHLDATFAALSDPTRRRILKLLLSHDMTVTDIAEEFTMTLAGISKHLQILSKAGLISRQRQGRIHWCRIEIDGLGRAFSWMQDFGFVDRQILNALECIIDDDDTIHSSAPKPQSSHRDQSADD